MRSARRHRTGAMVALIALAAAGNGCRSCDKQEPSRPVLRDGPPPAASGTPPGREPAGLLGHIQGAIKAIVPEPGAAGTTRVRLTLRPFEGADVVVANAPALSWSAGDEVFVRGPWSESDGGVWIDCARPYDCSVGLAQGADIRVRGLDLHHAARYLSRLFAQDVIVVGGSAEPLDFDIRATDEEGASRALAAAAGVSTRLVGDVRVFGPDDRLSSLEDASLPVRCYPASFEGYQVQGAELLEWLSERLRCRPLPRGALEGRATVVFKRRETARALALLLRLADAQWQDAKGAVSISERAAFPDIAAGVSIADETTKPGSWKDKIQRYPIDALVVAAIAVRQGEPSSAVLQPRTDRGFGWAQVVETGDVFSTSDGAGTSGEAGTGDSRAPGARWKVKTIERGKIIVRLEADVPADRTMALAIRPGPPAAWLARPPSAEVAKRDQRGCPEGMARAGGATCLDVTEVTVTEYQRCVKAGACDSPGHGGLCNAERAGGGQHPINCIAWDQARRYCAWSGKRLPFASEWDSLLRVPLPWGAGEPGSELVCWRRGQLGTCPVGRTRPEAYGLRGLAGNVSEWVEATGEPAGAHATRGGNFGTTKAEELVAGHTSLEATAAIGVRCAQSR